MLTETLIAVAIPTVAVIAWAVRLEGRVNTNEKLTDQRFLSLIQLVNTKFDSVKDSIESNHDETDRRLDRIERAMNGHLSNMPHDTR